MLEKEIANVHDELAMAEPGASQIVSHIPKEYSQITWYFITRRGSVVCHITKRRKKRKGLEIPCKHIYY